jgi:hypothetical protein
MEQVGPLVKMAYFGGPAAKPLFGEVAARNPSTAVATSLQCICILPGIETCQRHDLKV